MYIYNWACQNICTCIRECLCCEKTISIIYGIDNLPSNSLGDNLHRFCKFFYFKLKLRGKSSISFLKYLHTKVTVSIEICLYFLTKKGGCARDSPFGTFLLGVILAINVCEHIYHKFRSTHF